MFFQSITDLIKKHSITYLQAWIDKYEAHKIQESRSTEESKANLDEVCGESSETSVSTLAMDEYDLTPHETYEIMAANGETSDIQLEAQAMMKSGLPISSKERRLIR